MTKIQKIYHDFYKSRYTAEVVDSFEDGYYVNIYENNKLLTTLTIFSKFTHEAEEEALNHYVKQKHNY